MLWAIKERNDSPLNSPPGRQERFAGGMYDYYRASGVGINTGITGPLLFRSRREARVFIENMFGYIRNRKDLKSPPHCWHVPQAVRVTVTVTEIDHGKRPGALSRSYS